jgi:hypothetical protein
MFGAFLTTLATGKLIEYFRYRSIDISKTSRLDRMTNLTFDPQTLLTLIEQGYIGRQTHPNLPLTIYNYTAKAQYEKYWVAATLSCRGLVLDAEYRPIARPLPKFFNLSEYQGTLPDGVPQMARVLLANYQADLDLLDREYTYLFEIIYPTNRIVVDYGAAQRLVLLAAVETQTGVELDHALVAWPDRAVTYPLTTLPEWLESIDQSQAELTNTEGFVLKWPNGFRLKYKLADYVRLHRIITRIQAKDIWECLSENQGLDQFLEAVPDEFYKWVKDTKVDLEGKYRAIESECQEAFKDLGDRRLTAMYFQTQRYPGVLFLMLDGREYSQVIWKLIKPGFELPFRSDREG